MISNFLRCLGIVQAKFQHSDPILFLDILDSNGPVKLAPLVPREILQGGSELGTLCPRGTPNTFFWRSERADIQAMQETSTPVLYIIKAIWTSPSQDFLIGADWLTGADKDEDGKEKSRPI